MAFGAYTIEEYTPEQIAAQDPFAGHGLFLEMKEGSGPDILAALGDAAGDVLPAVALPGFGVWVDLRCGADREQLISRWGG